MERSVLTDQSQGMTLKTRAAAAYPRHGWIGLALIAVFWPSNWFMPGFRTSWAFFPLWLGYCLAVDALVFKLRGTSLFSRGWKAYAGLFAVSAPVWWIFELFNLRIHNWVYIGSEAFSPLGFFLIATINFSIVVPAVFGAAELMAGFKFIQRMKPWWVIRSDRRTSIILFCLGLLMLGLMLAWPTYFFPFAWLSVLFLLEPINIWLGHPALTRWTSAGDWRPLVSLFLGGLATGFFWEMWNYYAFPKWVYHVPGVGFLHIFEMPLLGYLGYLPFALELFAMYHLVTGLFGHKKGEILNIDFSQE